MNTIGLVVCMLGIVIHVVVKAKQELSKSDNGKYKNDTKPKRQILI
jgi:hypothetical protein